MHWQADSVPLSHLGSPKYILSFNKQLNTWKGRASIVNLSQGVQKNAMTRFVTKLAGPSTKWKRGACYLKITKKIFQDGDSKSWSRVNSQVSGPVWLHKSHTQEAGLAAHLTCLRKPQRINKKMFGNGCMCAYQFTFFPRQQFLAKLWFAYNLSF